MVLGLLWSKSIYAIEYCHEYNKSRKPLEPTTFTSIVFLHLELKCLGKTKEAKIFLQENEKLHENLVKSRIDTTLTGGPDVEKKLSKIEQDYINSIVELFYKLKK